MACTVTGTFLLGDGSPYIGEVAFIPHAPVANRGTMVVATPLGFPTDAAGKISVLVEVGNYEVKLENPSVPSFVISVPASGTRDITTLISANLTWLISPVGSQVSIATPTTFGIVKTDKVDPNPIVSLKSTTDAADDNLQTQIDALVVSGDLHATPTRSGNVKTDLLQADPIVYLKTTMDGYLLAINARIGANPSASVGMTAKAGTAVTYLRSDGAPALDVAIVPTWTGRHTHQGGVNTVAPAVASPTHLLATAADPSATAQQAQSIALSALAPLVSPPLAAPSATVALTAKPGVATSVMRSDGAPALDVAIAPTWSARHGFSGGLDAVAPAAAAPTHVALFDADPTTLKAQVKTQTVQQFRAAAQAFNVTATQATTTVTAGVRVKRDGSFISFTGGTVASPQTTGTFWLVLDSAGTLQYRTTYPGGAGTDDLVLAVVVVGVGTITVYRVDRTGGDLRGANNLGDVASVSGARVNLGLEVSSATLAVSAGGDTPINGNAASLAQNIIVTVSAGAAPYTATLSLTNSGVIAGSSISLTILLPASLNPTVQVRNLNASGTILYAASGLAYARVVSVRCLFNGSNWTTQLSGTATMDLTDAPAASSTLFLPVFDTDPTTGSRPLKSRTLAQAQGDLAPKAAPSALVGLTPVNGSSVNGMRADAAPALDVAIVPTWSGQHTFAGKLISSSAAGPDLRVAASPGAPGYLATWTASPTGGPATLQARDVASLKTDLVNLANPSATVALTAKPGVATTGMRSDAAPALDVSIVPTWTGLHTYSAGQATTAPASAAPTHMAVTDADPTATARVLNSRPLATFKGDLGANTTHAVGTPISGAGDTPVTVLSSTQRGALTYAISAGSGPYTATISLQSGAQVGAEIIIVLNFAASINPSVEVRSLNATGTLLYTVEGLTYAHQAVFRAWYSGSAWIASEAGRLPFVGQSQNRSSNNGRASAGAINCQGNGYVRSILSAALGTADFSVWMRVRIPSGPAPALTNGRIFNLSDGTSANRISCNLASGTGNLQVFASKAGSTVTSTTTPVAPYYGQLIDVVVTRSGTTLALWINGQLIGSVVNASADLNLLAGYFFDASTNTPADAMWLDRIYRAVLFNRVLLPGEIITLSPEGIADIDRWGMINNPFISPTVQNGGFETAGTGGTDVFGSWIEVINGGGGIWVRNTADVSPNQGSTASAQWIGDGSNSGALVSSFGQLVIGQRYRLRFEVKAIAGTTLNIVSSTTQVALGSCTMTAAWAPVLLEFVMTVTEGIRFIATGTQNWLLDNVTLEAVGAVVDLDLATGVGMSFPDRSSNAYHGIGSGAIRHVLPVRQGQSVYRVTVTGNTQLPSTPLNVRFRSINFNNFDPNTSLSVFIGSASGLSNILATTTIPVGLSTYTPALSFPPTAQNGTLWINVGAGLTANGLTVSLTYDVI